MSSSVMIVLIAMLTGISDIAALIAIFAVNAAMIFFGAVQEQYQRPGGSLWPFWLGCVVGIAPWLAVGVYLSSPGTTAEPPTFVYLIFVSLFVFFDIFALNMWLQYRRVGRWKSYLFGERAYFVLSLLRSRCSPGRCSPGRWRADALGPCTPSQPARGSRPSRGPLHDDLPSRASGDPAGPQGRRYVVVDPADFERATTTPERGRRRREGSRPRVSTWQERLRARMLAGDVAGSWQVTEAAMASGFEPGEIYVRLLAPALHEIGASWQAGRVSIDQEHLASSVATTLIGRLGPRFVHPGRKKGVVIVAMPPGERHGLGVAMLADILTDAGYGVLNLGPDTPTVSLVAAMRDAGSLAAVVVSVVDVERRPAAGRLLASARRERPSVPRLVGGHAVADEHMALELGANGWVQDPRKLGGLIEALRRRA